MSLQTQPSANFFTHPFPRVCCEWRQISGNPLSILRVKPSLNCTGSEAFEQVSVAPLWPFCLGVSDTEPRFFLGRCCAEAGTSLSHFRVGVFNILSAQVTLLPRLLKFQFIFSASSLQKKIVHSFPCFKCKNMKTQKTDM